MENKETLSPEAVEARRKFMREYMREWRKKNPEKVKMHNKQRNARYWEKKAIQLRLKNK